MCKQNFLNQTPHKQTLNHEKNPTPKQALNVCLLDLWAVLTERVEGVL
jgi:hypothetical protein